MKDESVTLIQLLHMYEFIDKSPGILMLALKRRLSMSLQGVYIPTDIVTDEAESGCFRLFFHGTS